jgi:hypothetical protein
MWLFTENAVLSVVEDKNNSERFCVRARFPGDIESIFGHTNANVIEGAGTDYRFRAFIDKPIVVEELTKEINNITYTNFKNRVAKASQFDDDHHYRMRMLHQVWNSMYEAQDDVQEMEGKNYGG